MSPCLSMLRRRAVFVIFRLFKLDSALSCSAYYELWMELFLGYAEFRLGDRMSELVDMLRLRSIT